MTRARRDGDGRNDRRKFETQSHISQNDEIAVSDAPAGSGQEPRLDRRGGAECANIASGATVTDRSLFRVNQEIRDAMASNDAPTLRGTLDDLDAGLENVFSIAGLFGGKRKESRPPARAKPTSSSRPKDRLR